MGSLRRARALAPDSTTGLILLRLNEIGFFTGGGVIGDTHALRTLPLMLGRKAPGAPSYTGDVDLIAPNALRLRAKNAGGLIEALLAGCLKVEMLEKVTDPKPLHWLLGARSF